VSAPTVVRRPDDPHTAGSRPGEAQPDARSRPGVRHGLVLALCAVVPVVHAMGAATAGRLPGFPVAGLVLLVAGVTVGAGLLGVDARRPGLSGIASRMAGAAVLAMAVRMTVPTPTRAIEEIREGASYLVSGAALVAFVALLLGFAAGHLVTSRTVVIARGHPALDAARAYDRQLLVSSWGTVLVLLLVAGLTHRTTGPAGLVVLAGALLTGLTVVADLRSRIPPPGGASRPPIVAAPGSIARNASLLAVAIVVLLTALTVPLVPAAVQEGLGRPSEWTADLIDLDWDPARPPVWSPDGLREALLDDHPFQFLELPALPEERVLAVPSWLRWALVAGAVAGLLVVLRPDRWGPTLRRMWAAMRGAGGEDDEELFETLEPLGEDEEDDAPPGRVRGVLERVRPRPRDPRQAIVHDYLRVDRLLSRDELGRAVGETPLEHAARVGSSSSDGGLPALDELAGLVSAARYGRTAPTSQVVDRSRALQQQLERDLRARR
jgi:hypothetical protein